MGKLPKSLLSGIMILFFASMAASFSTSTTSGPQKEQLSSHLHFFLHHISTNKTQSSVTVAKSPVTENTLLYGQLDIVDYPLTVGFEPQSMPVGKAVGISALALSAEEGASWLTVLNLAFTEGKFNGSTVYLLGRETEYFSSESVREVPVIAGTGALRFATGYAHIKPPVPYVNVSSPGFDDVEEYDLYVSHY